VTVSFVIQQVRGKGRPRFGVVRGRAMAFTDPQTRAYEKVIKAAASNVMAGREPLQGPVWVRVDAFVPVPKGTSKVKAAAMLAGDIRPTKKPDLDNVLKAILDGINGVIYGDDKQVVAFGSTKRYGEQERILVTVGQCDADGSHG
jgi:Holliday junction resolvase RusA-like endonuclease